MHPILPVILLSALSASPQFDVQLLDGSKLTGSLAACSDKHVTIETSAGRRELDVDKVASIAAHAPAKSAAAPLVWVDLADGSRIAGTEYTTEKGQAKIALLPAGEIVELPTSQISAARLQPESDTTAIEWSRLRGKKLEGDLLVTGNQTGIDFHQGTIESVTGSKVRFVLNGDTLGVKREKVYGLIYYHAGAAPPAEATYTITDVVGSRWAASSLKLENDKLEFTTAGGRQFKRPLGQVIQVDLSCGKIVFLSDLKPDSEKYSPNQFTVTERELASRVEFSRVRRDENAESKPLATHGQDFRKGLAIQSRSELAWTLPGKFSRLEAVAGIDDWFRPLGNVRLQVVGDGKPLFDREISGGDKDAAPISLDMTGVRRLVVTVDSQGNFGTGDHLILGNLRLIK
jgi:hypothetical protein